MVVICGAANLYNDAVCYALSRELKVTCNIVESPGDLSDVSSSVREDAPSLLLVDSSSCSLDRVVSELELALRKTHYRIPLAVYNVSQGQQIPPGLARQGVRGVFYVRDNLSQFLEGVRRLLEGEILHRQKAIPKQSTDDAIARVAAALAANGLARREAEILAHVSLGETNEVIAARLQVRRRTVEYHLSNIYHALGVPDRFQASLWVARNMH